MMATLIWKELRGLKAFAALIAGIIAISYCYLLATKFPDTEPFRVEGALNGGHLVLILLFAVTLGAGLLVRESDDGTLSFLDGLPIARTRIFWAKWIAALLILWLIPFLDLGQDVLFGVLSQTSIAPPLPWKFIGCFFGLCLFTAIYSLSAALALSFLRRWFAMLLGLIVLGFLWAESRGIHWIEMLNPNTLQPSVIGEDVKIPFRTLGVQSAATVVCLVIAWLAFHFLGARSRDPLDRSGRLGRWIVSLGRLATPLIWVGVFVLFAKARKDGPSDAPGIAGESVFARRDTAHYEFLFRESQREKISPILHEVDSVYGTVAHFFGVVGASDRIVVDLASPVASHTAGMTAWTKIRVPLGHGLTTHEADRILGHETAHVMMHQIGGEFFFKDFEATRFFNEGMATVVEQKYFSDEGEVRAMRRLTAAVAARGKVSFATLCSNEALSRSRDPELVYPFGSAFCYALIETYGDDAPGKVVSEFKHPRYGPEAVGETLWRDVLQKCGFSLDRVVAAYDGDLARLQTEEASFLATIPRLSATIQAKGDEFLLEPHYEGKAPGKIVCCVKHDTVMSDGREWHWPEKDGTIHVPKSEVTGATVHYMLGWAVDSLPWPVFEPWVEKAADVDGGTVGVQAKR